MREKLTRFVLNPRQRSWAILAFTFLLPFVGWGPLELLWFAHLYACHGETDSRGMKVFYRVMMVLVGGLLLHNVINLLILFGALL